MPSAFCKRHPFCFCWDFLVNLAEFITQQKYYLILVWNLAFRHIKLAKYSEMASVNINRDKVITGIFKA